MTEVFEFRISEDFAHLMFTPEDGQRLGDSVRKVTLPIDDPRFQRVGELQAYVQKEHDRLFFFSWRVLRKYSAVELDHPGVINLHVTTRFEPTGEECGTAHDDSCGCAVCGAGAPQVTPLILALSRIPRLGDFASSIAGEVIVRKRVVDLFEAEGITGAAFHPVVNGRARGEPSPDWFQLLPGESNVQVASRTRCGIDPFDPDPGGRYRCPFGHLLGLNVISEVYLDSTLRSSADFFASERFVGARRGLLRPERLLFASPRLARLINRERLSGVALQVAHWE
jgi:hypothetical protein